MSKCLMAPLLPCNFYLVVIEQQYIMKYYHGFFLQNLNTTWGDWYYDNYQTDMDVPYSETGDLYDCITICFQTNVESLRRGVLSHGD